MLTEKQLKLEDRPYASPQCKVVRIKAQAILCASDDPTEKVEETEGEW